MKTISKNGIAVSKHFLRRYCIKEFGYYSRLRCISFSRGWAYSVTSSYDTLHYCSRKRR